MRTRRRLLVGLGLVSVVLAVSAFAVYQLVLGRGVAGLTPLGGIAFILVGMLLVARRPDNLIGGLVVAMGVLWAVGEAVFAYLLLSVEFDLPATDVAVWLEQWVYWPMLGLGIFVIALFPTGRLATSQMRWPLAATIAIATLEVATRMVLPVDPGVQILTELFAGNPWAVESLTWLVPVTDVLDVLYVALFAVVVIDLVRRWRHSAGIERLQMRWLAMGVVTFVVLLLAAIVLQATGVTSLAFDLAWMALALIPVSIGIAILRHRLYEIDRLISRTVSYALVVGALAGVFSLIAIGIPQLLGMTGDAPPLLVAGATLAVAGLFNPLRRRTQEWVDRRFNRSRYDAQREVNAFAERLRNEVELDDLSGELIDVVSKTLQPSGVAVWVRQGG